MSSRVLIAGGGVVGCLSAMVLAERGWHVTLIDQGVLGGESSWAGGGIMFPLLPWKYTEPVNRLALAGASLYPALCEQLLAATGIDPQYQACGMRIMPNYGGEAALQWCQAHGIAAEKKLETKTEEKIEKKIEKQVESLWLPQVAQVRNPRLMQALHAFLLARGVQVFENVALAPLQAEAGRLTAWPSIGGQRFEADAFVLTAGAWSRNLLGAQALNLKVKPMRGQMLLYKLEPGVLRNMIYHEDFYLIPRRDGHIIAGSTVEDVGFDKSTTQEAAAQLAAKAANLLPQLAHAPVIRHWSGLRPGSPDNIPVIARHPRFDNLYLNTGHFRYGVTMAPSSADMLAALMSDEPSSLDAAAYAFPG